MKQQKMNVLDHNNNDNKLRRNNGMRGDEDNSILFMMMLRQLTIQRFKIKEAMIFCLDHSDRAVEIGEILSEALTLSETTFNKKLGRLFLVSDVLCNCNTAKI